ncbi:PREDICTED: 4-hydroxybutyrate coenzyme A transferase-like [Priapulus caudatus]|uniref:4-hydroxybutyrate coenzyme A transferase-like n=1 Tax=Priapulus caudatus TaxID=37621 RepID=A0ABM1DT42_PRICU|nr:PREDICTED: 4-hydroxybutyrate coenzyme A transferase-like [Priapulus caudatus]
MAFRRIPCCISRNATLTRERIYCKNAARTYYTYSPEPFHPLPNRAPVWRTADEAVTVIKSHDKVFVHGAAATPIPLLEAMAKHGLKSGVKHVEVMHIHTEGEAIYSRPEYEGVFRSNSLFIGPNVRSAVNEGRADFIPIFLSEIPLLFRRNLVQLDVALISVSPPDKHGFCTLGPSVDCTRAAVQNAKVIIGLINPNMPRTFGDTAIHISHFDMMVEGDNELQAHEAPTLSEEEKRIGMHIAGNLVPDGATLQMGIGSIPDAVLAQLTHHRDLGVHTEMFSDKVMELVVNGCVTNAHKTIYTGKMVSSFVIGSPKLYKFLHNNPFVALLDVAYVNHTATIMQNPKVTAINSCIEVDFTGQVVSDSIGERMYSGVGGQVDFIRGAALGHDGLGKPIIAMPSTTAKGASKIVATLKPGAGVVTTRGHVHYIVTEYGIAHVFGKNLRQRAYELIRIAHPSHREELEKAAFERLKCMPSP